MKIMDPQTKLHVTKTEVRGAHHEIRLELHGEDKEAFKKNPTVFLTELMAKNGYRVNSMAVGLRPEMPIRIGASMECKCLHVDYPKERESDWFCVCVETPKEM